MGSLLRKKRATGSAWVTIDTVSSTRTADGSAWNTPVDFAEGLITYRGISSVSSSFQQSLTLSAVSGAAAGDMAFVFGTVISNRTVTPPGGWTQVSVLAPSGSGVRTYLWRRELTGTEVAADYTFENSSANSSMCLRQVVFTGVNSTTPIEGTPSTHAGTGGTSIRLAYTTVLPGSVILFGVGMNPNAARTSVFDPNMTKIADVSTTNCRIVTAYEEIAQANQRIARGVSLLNSTSTAPGYQQFAGCGVILRPA